MKFGLQGARTLLDYIGHPERKFPSIHIAGTNGKGSTASMIASIFTAAGYKTGLYTSPHLVRFNERIRINGIQIPSQEVAKLVSIIQSEVKRNNNTFFEAVTAIAFKYFADSAVDIAIVETGLGGRLDATNVLKPIVSVITTIGFEHTQILGTSLEKIASEKGGIIKKGVPCITGIIPRRADQVLTDISRKRKSLLYRIHRKNIHFRNSSLDGLIVDFKMSNDSIKNVHISLAGEHQGVNALLAINAIELAIRYNKFTISKDAIRKGLKRVQRYSGIQARLSIIKRNPIVIIDVAHNQDAMDKLCASLRRLHIGKMHIVLGLMKDKAYKEIISILQRITKTAFIVKARTDRSRETDELVKEFLRYKIPTVSFNSVVKGVESVLELHDNVPVLITGSHFVVGEAMASLKKEKYLTINQ
jgi:dihydrofolate synthase/folylpolyglutamate synthase